MTEIVTFYCWTCGHRWTGAPPIPDSTVTACPKCHGYRISHSKPRQVKHGQ
ncbi:MAG: hypothetical protein WC455_21905 [Dehalococcoidia bacterium]